MNYSHKKFDGKKKKETWGCQKKKTCILFWLWNTNFRPNQLEYVTQKKKKLIQSFTKTWIIKSLNVFLKSDLITLVKVKLIIIHKVEGNLVKKKTEKETHGSATAHVYFFTLHTCIDAPLLPHTHALLRFYTLAYTYSLYIVTRTYSNTHQSAPTCWLDFPIFHTKILQRVH